VLFCFFIDASETYRILLRRFAAEASTHGSSGEYRDSPKAPEFHVLSDGGVSHATARDTSMRVFFEITEGACHLTDEHQSNRDNGERAYNLPHAGTRSGFLTSSTPLKSSSLTRRGSKGWDNPNVFQIAPARQSHDERANERPSPLVCACANQECHRVRGFEVNTHHRESRDRELLALRGEQLQRRSRTTPVIIFGDRQTTVRGGNGDGLLAGHAAPVRLRSIKLLWRRSGPLAIYRRPLSLRRAARGAEDAPS